MLFNKLEQDQRIEEAVRRNQVLFHIISLIILKHHLVLDMTILKCPYQFKNAYPINNRLDYLVLQRKKQVLEQKTCHYK